MPNSYNAITITSVATLIFALKNHREGSVFYNNSAQTVYLGMDSSVTTSNGLPIVAGAYLLNSGYLHNWRGNVYGIVASGTADCRYWDWENQ